VVQAYFSANFILSKREQSRSGARLADTVTLYRMDTHIPSALVAADANSHRRIRGALPT
jgi:hypothetical protein